MIDGNPSIVTTYERHLPTRYHFLVDGARMSQPVQVIRQACRNLQSLSQPFRIRRRFHLARQCLDPLNQFLRRSANRFPKLSSQRGALSA